LLIFLLVASCSQTCGRLGGESVHASVNMERPAADSQ
jgi:hypothetical protein